MTQILPHTKKKKSSTIWSNNFQIDWWILLPVIFLLLIGLAYLYSAIIAKTASQDAIAVIQRQSSGILNREFAFQLFIGIGLGGLIAIFLSRLDYHKLFPLSPAALWVTILLLSIIFFPVIVATIHARTTGGSTAQALLALSESTKGFLYYANNSIRWIKVGFTIQPAEIAKIVLLLYLASVVDKYQELNLLKYKKPIILTLITLGMIIVQPDLGSLVLIVVILLSGVWVAGVRVRYFAGLFILLAIFASIFITTTSYRNTRVVTWVYQNFCREISLKNPPPPSERHGICKYVDISSKNIDAYQTDQIRTALARGGLTGVGYNNGDLKTIIPEVRTDGIIGVIGEESGMVMVLFVLLLYSMILFRGLTIARNAPDTGGKILATGITIWITFQALWNITGMTGLIPMKGLTLPFISEGNSSMIVMLAAVGILMNISSQQIANPSQRPSLLFANKPKKRHFFAKPTWSHKN